ncbi:tetratricopeptide repeat protein [Kocuria palustris]|nr:tetratricopeptide repeat protein [Kocuria palustris]
MDDDKKLELAVIYFHNSRYDKALSIYNELEDAYNALGPMLLKQLRADAKVYNLASIPPIHPNLPKVLDQRAATYEKLGNFAKALADARALVAKDPLNCKGYLRLGKLLEKRGDLTGALSTYSQGITKIKSAFKQSKIKPPPKQYQALKENHERLQAMVKTPAQHGVPELTGKRTSSTSFSTAVPKKTRVLGRDPFNMLPLEIIELIFRQIPLPCVLQCHLVCKRWYSSLIQLPSLYRLDCRLGVTVPQFERGVQLVKRISSFTRLKEISSVKIKHAANLERCLRCMITEPGLFFQNIDISDRQFSLSSWIHLMSKSGWTTHNFKRVTKLSLGLVSLMTYGNILLSIFPNLKRLRVLILRSDMDREALNVITTEKAFRRFSMIDQHEKLEELILVNHPKLNREKQSATPGPATYLAVPPFLNHTFANLVELTMANYDFENRLPQLGEFFLKTANLKRLWFENNLSITLLEFFQLLQNYQPSFHLEDLTFRERYIPRATNLVEFTSEDLHQLHDLRRLDVYGSLLTTQGLKKLLRLSGKHLTTLQIGNCCHVEWPQDIIGQQHHVLRWKTLFKYAPALQRLSVRNSLIDQFTLSMLSQLEEPHKLEELDLSFCSNVKGVGLLYLLQYPVKKLRLIGVDIDSQTLAYMSDRNPHLLEIESDPRATSIFTFGIDSWIQPL